MTLNFPRPNESIKIIAIPYIKLICDGYSAWYNRNGIAALYPEKSREEIEQMIETALHKIYIRVPKKENNESREDIDRLPCWYSINSFQQ